jgi:hypothetical protein
MSSVIYVKMFKSRRSSRAKLSFCRWAVNRRFVSLTSPPRHSVDFIQVYTADEVQAARAAIQLLGKIQYNTSGIQDTIINREGATTYFRNVSRRWKEWLAHRASAIPDMHLVYGQGIAGENGIYGGWERLSNGAVRPEEGLVYSL